MLGNEPGFGPFPWGRAGRLFNYHCPDATHPGIPSMADKKGSPTEKVLYCSFCGTSQHEVK